MNETLVTLVGNAATGVEFRETASGGMARFRFAVTPRRWDREKQLWADGHTSFYTVWAWRTLASNLTGSVAVGEPLVVHGRLKVREEEREGQRRTFVDIEAVAVGHDLTRGTSAFRRVVKADPALTARTGARTADEPDRWAVRERPADREHPADRADREHPAGRADREHPADRADREHPAGRADREHPAGRADREHPAGRADREHPADRADRKHPADRAEPRAAEREPVAAGRAAGPAAKRRTARQKTAPELVSAP